MVQQAYAGGDNLTTALETAAASLSADPETAAMAASEILDTYPGQPQALLLLACALKMMGAEESATGFFHDMGEQYPNLAAVHYETGLFLGKRGRTKEAVEHLSRTVALEPNHPAAWRALGNHLSALGDRKGSLNAYVRHLRHSLKELKLIEDATSNGPAEAQAENMLRQSLGINPTDVFARRTLGEVALRLGQLREAETTLKDALELAPNCDATRYLYCMALTQLMDWNGANVQLQILLKKHPRDPHLESLLVGNLAMRGEREEALTLLDGLHPAQTNDRVVWLNYALGARALGQTLGEIIEAYRKCLELDPGFGTAWWGLADLKTYRFSQAEIGIMRDQLARNDISDGPRCHIEFALGAALETEGVFAESFEHYRKGNELRRPYIKYNADTIHNDIMRAKQFFTQEFLSSRSDVGCSATDPIFIVGMPRAGSTLVEQILASHSQVEGTMELSELGDIVVELMRQQPNDLFPDLLGNLDAGIFRKLGESYLERTQYQRKLGRIHFTDKAGVNFVHVGLIHLILPNAKIIDARRHPLACGFSCYKQAFAPGALLLAYDQTDIGRYYRDYVEVMAHYDEVLPGRVYRLFHEHLVRDPETEIRRLLEYCGLPFEESCLNFHKTDRSIRTSSSQQVRQPIRKKAVEDWQHYEKWLQPMKDALGDVLTCYPDAPSFR